MKSITQRAPDPDSIPECVAVAGASGGIGGALCTELARRYPAVTLVRLARHPADLPALKVASFDIAFDIGEESTIRRAAEQLPDGLAIDWLLVATGWLHDADHQPEKTFRSLNADHLMHAYLVNAIGPALLIKHLIPRLNLRAGCRVGVLSARVGSISDNRLGGWHAYRASKAALNMLIRNYAIEIARKHERFTIVGLQPGTTDTALSRPFQRNLPEGQLQSASVTASHLVDVVSRLRPEDSGMLFDFLGVPFEP